MTDAPQTTCSTQVNSHAAVPLSSSASHSTFGIFTAEPSIGTRCPESQSVIIGRHKKAASRFQLQSAVTASFGWLTDLIAWVRNHFDANAQEPAIDQLFADDQRLYQGIMNYENGIRHLQQENTNLRQEFDGRVRQETQYLREQCHDRLQQERREQASLTESRMATLQKQHEAEMARKNEVIRKRDTEIGKLHNLAVRLEDTVAARDTQIVEYETRVQSQQEAIRDLQASAMKSLEAAYWAPDSAENIQRQMKDLMLDIEDWAERFSLLPLEILLEHERFGRVETHLKRSGCIGSLGKLEEAIVANEDLRQPGRASALMLSTIVSFEVFGTVFCSPFFAFAGTCGQQHELLQHADGDAAQSICELIRRGKPES
ncbi:uncharacterized protein MYCFIDRAFT_78007 [Pseudocercospora fijiensis CIRAD86]|uniref:Uncharacterized protein n=1 Tax=Pseudocercospora fijiensis (strain CIRAD86) TaxID=383855 RepID=M3A6M8_PSEFD|nr:uncharacterized protein MYCFIDRAFT_78007 [Pseudocercospora fijiensis CIRAD86]EME80246.1 hypothetical protein MYCFIDRAFT_78007 [Pseudocercospora fijiensis CIRAD86]